MPEARYPVGGVDRLWVPKDMHMFASGYETDRTLAYCPVSDEDRMWAEGFLKDFRAGSLEPARKTPANRLRGCGEVAA